MEEITSFTEMIPTELQVIEEETDFTPLDLEYDSHIRGILSVKDTLKDLPKAYDNIFTAIEAYRQLYYPNTRINISEEFLNRVADDFNGIDSLRSRFNYYRSQLGWGYEGNYSTKGKENFIFISSIEEHYKVVEDLSQYTQDLFIEDISDVRNNLLIVYRFVPDSDITSEFVVTHKSDILIDGQTCNVINTTSESYRKSLELKFNESMKILGDFPFITDKLNSLAEVFENNKYIVSNLETYNIQMNNICEGIDGFVYSDALSESSMGLVKQTVAEMIIQRGKAVALLTNKDGHIQQDSKLLFDIVSGEYIINIPNLTNKIRVIRNMSKLMLFKKEGDIFLTVLDEIPNITVIASYYCAFDESHRTFIKLREGNRIDYSEVIDAEEVMEFKVSGNQQARNRELLMKFAESANIGIDLNSCVFFKRNDITYIGVGCTIDVRVKSYLIPYEGEVEHSTVLSKKLSYSDLSSVLPLDCIIFNTDRINSLLNEISIYRRSKVNSVIASSMSRSMTSIMSVVNKSILSGKYTSNDTEKLINYTVKKLPWKSLCDLMTILVSGSTNTGTFNFSQYITLPNGTLSLTPKGVDYLNSINILPVDKYEHYASLLVVNELISKKITKELVIEYTINNLNILEDYPQCEEELEYIKGIIGKQSDSSIKELNLSVDKLLSVHTDISGNIVKHLQDTKQVYISKLFTGYSSTINPIRVSDDTLRFKPDKYPILLRHLKPIDFDSSKTNLSDFDLLCNFQAEDLYKRTDETKNKELNVMRAVAQYNEFNIPVITANYSKNGGHLSLYARGGKIENE